MPKHVILTNIGNRNIKYLNQGYPNDEIPKKVFFSKTKFLWENQEELKNISLAILPAIIEAYSDAIVYLFTTLQEPVFEQDTYYEGLIIAKLLKEKYPLLQVESIEMKNIRANSEDELIPWYRDKINSIRKVWKDAIYIMYDTGGTPQQKSSLKAVVQYYFKKTETVLDSDEKTFKLYQGNDDSNGGTTIEEIKRTASEKLNQLTNVKLLIWHNNYSAAKILLPSQENNALYMVIDYASLRWENMWNEIKKHYQTGNFPKQVKIQEEFDVVVDSDYLNINKISNTQNDLSIIASRDCRNLISKANNQSSYGNYSGAILSFHQFIESYIYGYIESNSPYKIYSDYSKTCPALLQFLKTEYYDYFVKIFGNFPYNISLPVLISFASLLSKNNNVENNLLIEIKETQSFFKNEKYPQNKKLDSLRNAIAHEGKGVSVEDFQLYEILISKTHYLFLPEHDSFKRINQLIEKLM